jgi:NAD-dependent deacetylase
MTIDQQSVESAADIIAARRPMVALTGAGISVESGIPDFRSAGGLWERFDPAEYATIEAFRAAPAKVWAMIRELDSVLEHAAPNPAHHALATLEQAGVLSAVITQNIDNLHQDAGSTQVVEFHGNGRWLLCLDCDLRLGQRDERVRPDAQGVPRCPGCGAILKPDVVLFGEPIPEPALARSYDLACRCGVMLVAGTSATVMPAAAMPLLARRCGATLIEVNLEQTELTPSVDIALRGSAGTVLPALADAVLRRLEAA